MTAHIDLGNLPAFDEMNADQFLGWLLDNCEMSDQEIVDIRALVQDFLLGRLAHGVFDALQLESMYPNLHGWLEKTRKDGEE